MKVTKFAHYLNKFFTFYLPEIIGCTPATIDSYRYSFIHFLNCTKSLRDGKYVNITHNFLYKNRKYVLTVVKCCSN
jgi:hypothetical protein